MTFVENEKQILSLVLFVLRFSPCKDLRCPCFICGGREKNISKKKISHKSRRRVRYCVARLLRGVGLGL